MSFHDPAVAPVDYDSAFVARLRDGRGQICFPRTIEWLVSRQRPDGTWGSDRFHAHDRLVSTLAAALCLHEAEIAESAVERAIRAIPGLLAGLSDDANETIGFEVLAPRLMDLCGARGLFVPTGLAMERRRREERLSAGAKGTVLFSLEGLDVIAAEVGAYLGPSGSLFASPAATAAYLMAHPDTPRAWSYIERLAERGGIPAVDPLHSFVVAWSCWHMDLSGQGHLREAALLRERVARSWTPKGASFSDEFAIPNSDDTAMSFLVQCTAGRCPEGGIGVFEPFMTPEGARCYLHEYDASVSSNVHILLALRAAAPGRQRDEWVATVLRYLHRALESRSDGLLADKWHVSPIYTQSHAILATHGLDDRLCERLTDALLAAQQPDGAWGDQGGSAEEVAYALYALCSTYKKRYRDAVRTGSEALSRLRRGPHPALWIGKSLYHPTAVVESAIDAARTLAERTLPSP